MSKRCVRCERTKSVNEFHRCARASDGRQSWCKRCVAEHDRERRSPERTLRKRDQDIRRQYGMSLTTYRAWLAFGCSICGRGASDGAKMHMDHCHDRGAVRGPLCSKCNMALGLFNDNPELLEMAIAYIQIEAEDKETVSA